MPIKEILAKHGIEEKVAGEIAKEIRSMQSTVIEELTEHYEVMVARYRGIIRSNLPIVMTGPDLKTIIEVSDGAVDYWGYSRGEITRMDVRKLYVDPDVRNGMENDFKENKPVMSDVRFRTKNGEIKIAEVFVGPIKDSRGQIVGTLGIAIDKDEETRLKKETIELGKRAVNNYLSNIYIQIDSLEGRYPEYAGHSERVAEYVCGFISSMREKLAERFDQKLVENYNSCIEKIKMYVQLHDYGKIDIVERVLRSKRKYKSDRNPVAKHAIMGCELMEKNLCSHNYPYDDDLRVIMRNHHERWDGKGYPDGLEGEGIPLIARIVSIADAYDAMTNTRSYRKRIKTAEEATKELQKCAGTQFDPVLVPLFTKYLRENKNV